jgi:molybdopterin converting factor small subunit
MIEIKYGDQYEVADLAGQTVSEAREQFKAEFGIPDKAKAKLNGSKVKSSAELDTVLNDDDKLTFAVSRGKGAYLVGALLLALAVTGGVFAATATSDTVTLGITVDSDLATVNGSTGPGWNVYKRFKGTIDSAGLFSITPDGDFSGDLLASLYITNGDDLARVYNALVMKIQIFNNSGANVTEEVYLTLDNAAVSLAFNQSTADPPYTVNCTGGYFSNFRWSAIPTVAQASPTIFCEVTQASP